MTYRFHHIHLICKDLEGMISFFTEALGTTLVERKKFGTADGASLDLQGTTVNLRVAREDEDMAGDASRTTFGYPDLRIAFFRGPEEIIIELVQN